MDVREQRVEFVVAATRKSQSFGSLCDEFGISRPTGYLWLHRYQQQGTCPGLPESAVAKPLRSPGCTQSAVEQRVLQVRRRYPDWGARKLRVVLSREGLDLAHQHHPSHSAASWPGERRSINTLPRCNGLSASSQMNCGRWISRGRRDGRSRSALCQCWTIIAAT